MENKAVTYAKNNPIWRWEYMRWDLELENERMKARAEGESMLAKLIMELTPGTDEYRTALQGTEEERRRLYEKYGI